MGGGGRRHRREGRERAHGGDGSEEAWPTSSAFVRKRARDRVELDQERVFAGLSMAEGRAAWRVGLLLRPSELHAEVHPVAEVALFRFSLSGGLKPRSLRIWSLQSASVAWRVARELAELLEDARRIFIPAADWGPTLEGLAWLRDQLHRVGISAMSERFADASLYRTMEDLTASLTEVGSSEELRGLNVCLLDEAGEEGMVLASTNLAARATALVTSAGRAIRAESPPQTGQPRPFSPYKFPVSSSSISPPPRDPNPTPPHVPPIVFPTRPYSFPATFTPPRPEPLMQETFARPKAMVPLMAESSFAPKQTMPGTAAVKSVPPPNTTNLGIGRGVGRTTSRLLPNAFHIW